MKPVWKSVLFLAAAALVLCAGCSRKEAVLHVYTWADYIKPELVQQFEKENRCRVVIDTFDSNEVMYAKLKAGAEGYDIITPSSYMVKIMDGQGMLEPLDHSLLPNLKHVDRDYLRSALDPEMHHSVPYMLTTTVIAYLKSRVPDFEATWAVFDRADLKGRMTVLNDMRETIGAGLKYLGYSLNTTNEKELAEARDVILRWKRNIAKFENEQYKTGLASGEFFVVAGTFSGFVGPQGGVCSQPIVNAADGAIVACVDNFGVWSQNWLSGEAGATLVYNALGPSFPEPPPGAAQLPRLRGLRTRRRQPFEEPSRRLLPSGSR